MKAKDYYEKYSPQVFAEGANVVTVIRKMFMEMSEEGKTIMVQRKCKADDAVLAVIKEQNEKWNAISRLFTKHHNQTPLARNGFMNFWNSVLKTEKEKKHE